MTESEQCAECGFDSTRLTVADAIVALRSMGRRWREAFANASPDELRRRPAPEVWSPVEYAAHTRDVLGLFAAALPSVLDGSQPSYPSVEPSPPGPDRSGESDPTEAIEGLDANATRLADIAAQARSENWDRTAKLGDHERDAAYLLFHAVHDASHHLRDVEKQLHP